VVLSLEPPRTSFAQRRTLKIAYAFFACTNDGELATRTSIIYLNWCRWRVAGRNCDIIDALLNIGQSASNAHLKRLRDDEDDVSAPPNVPEISVHTAKVPITGSSTLVAQQMQELERSIEETGHLFSLPLHTEELGRLPVYDSFHYEFTFNSNDIHYQPQSYLNPPYDVSDPIPPQLLRSVDPALGDTRSCALRIYICSLAIQIQFSPCNRRKRPAWEMFNCPQFCSIYRRATGASGLVLLSLSIFHRAPSQLARLEHISHKCRWTEPKDFLEADSIKNNAVFVSS
jgi:hypothetical protein